MLEFWPVYSGERFRASWPSCHCFSEKIRLDISCESSARQRIYMKHQALFPRKDKSKKIKCRLLQLLFGTLRLKYPAINVHGSCKPGMSMTLCVYIRVHILMFGVS